LAQVIAAGPEVLDALAARHGDTWRVLLDAIYGGEMTAPPPAFIEALLARNADATFWANAVRNADPFRSQYGYSGREARDKVTKWFAARPAGVEARLALAMRSAEIDARVIVAETRGTPLHARALLTLATRMLDARDWAAAEAAASEAEPIAGDHKTGAMRLRACALLGMHRFREGFELLRSALVNEALFGAPGLEVSPRRIPDDAIGELVFSAERTSGSEDEWIAALTAMRSEVKAADRAIIAAELARARE
jgi:hypothetical protein